MSSAKPPLLEHATRGLARFASGLRFEDLPKEVVERIKLSVLDSLGCCLFGAPSRGRARSRISQWRKAHALWRL